MHACCVLRLAHASTLLSSDATGGTAEHSDNTRAVDEASHRLQSTHLDCLVHQGHRVLHVDAVI